MTTIEKICKKCMEIAKTSECPYLKCRYAKIKNEKLRFEQSKAAV